MYEQEKVEVCCEPGGTQCARTSGDAKVMDDREAPLLRLSEGDFASRRPGLMWNELRGGSFIF